MSGDTPSRPRWTRVGNPVKPSVVTFPGGDSAAAAPLTRVSNPITRSIITFGHGPELKLVLKRHPESDPRRLPQLAARLIHKVDALDRQMGGPGLRYDPAGTRDEPTRLVLRLVPKADDDGDAARRLARLAEEVNRLASEARQRLIERQEADIAEQIARQLDESHAPFADLVDVEACALP